MAAANAGTGGLGNPPKPAEAVRGRQSLNYPAYPIPRLPHSQGLEQVPKALDSALTKQNRAGLHPARPKLLG